MSILRASILLAIAALLFGCGDGAIAVPRQATPAPEPTWTVVVYGSGDNDLTDSLDVSIAAMSKATLGPSVDVVVIADHDDRAHLDVAPRGTEWLGIRGGGEDPTLLRREPEKNFDDPAVLQDIVARAFAEHPSKRRALVLWGHGGGWARGFGGDTADGALLPGTTSPMPIDAMAGAIAAGLSTAGGSANLDLLGLDACLMSGVETAYVLRDVAGVLIASAEIDYGAGWDYQGFLSLLASRPDASAADLAKQEVALWDAWHEGTVDDQVLKSQDALDLSKIDAVASAVAGLGKAVIPEVSSLGVLFVKAAFFSMPAYGGDVGEARKPTLHDLGQMASVVTSRPELASVHEQAAAVLATIDAAVIARAGGTLRAGQKGLSIGLPTDDDPGSFASAYAANASAWDGVAHWSDMVGAIGALADGEAPDLEVTPMFPDGVPTPDLPVLLDVISKSPDVVGAMAFVVRQEQNGTSTYLGLTGVAPLAPNQHGAFLWDGRLHELASPAGNQPVSSSLWLFGLGDPSGNVPLTALLAIPGIVTAPGAPDRPAQALFSKGIDEAASIVVSFDGFSRALDPGAVATIVPGASFVPLLDKSLDASSMDPVLEQPIPLPTASTLTHVLVAAPPASYALAVVARDVWGNATVKLVPIPASPP